MTAPMLFLAAANWRVGFDAHHCAPVTTLVIREDLPTEYLQ